MFFGEHEAGVWPGVLTQIVSDVSLSSNTMATPVGEVPPRLTEEAQQQLSSFLLATEENTDNSDSACGLFIFIKYM